MSQALTSQVIPEIRMESHQGWRLWRTLNAVNEMEYVLSAQELDDEVCAVMAQAISGLLESMAVGVLISDGEGKGQFAKTVMNCMGHLWPDSRLMMRETGAMYVAIADDRSHAPVAERLLALAQEQKKPVMRVIGYRGMAAPEIRFANLMAAERRAEIELEFSSIKQPMLRIRFDQERLSDAEIWERLQASWMRVTAR